MDSFIDKFAQRKNAQEMIRANAMAEAEERKKMAAQLSEYERAMQEIRRCNLQNIENAEKVRELLTASLNKIAEVQKRDEGNNERTEKAVAEVRNLLETLKSRITELLERQQSQITEVLERRQSQITEVLERQQSQITELLEKQQSQTAEVLERQQGQTAECMEAQKKAIEELLHASDEFNHKEAVKVYRNVQAVIEGALPKQTEEITEAFQNAQGKNKAAPGMVVIWVLTFAAAAASAVIEVLRILGYL